MKSFKIKPVTGTSIYRELTKEWPSQTKAAEALGCDHRVIVKHIKSGEPLNGYILRRK